MAGLRNPLAKLPYFTRKNTKLFNNAMENKENTRKKIPPDCKSAGTGKIENGELVWKTWYPVRDNNVRKELLIRRKV